MNDSELKPCPFCGGKVKFINSCLDHSDMIGIHCKKCKTEVQFYDRKTDKTIHGEKKIGRRWNKRKAP